MHGEIPPRAVARLDDRRRHNALDQAAQDAGRFPPGGLIAPECRLQLLDLPAIDLGQVRQEGNDRSRILPRAPGLVLQLVAPTLELDQAPPHVARVGAVSDRVDQPCDLGCDVTQLAIAAVPLGDVRAALAIRLVADSHHERLERVGREQAVAHAAQHALLELGEADGVAIVARALLPPARADHPRPIVRYHRPAAAAAGDEAREQMPRSPLVRGGAVPRRGLDRLRPAPRVVLDDAQAGHVDLHPVAARDRAPELAAGFRVLPERLSPEHQAADVDGIVEDPALALAVAVDGARVPPAAAWARHMLAVQIRGDRARALAADVFGVDPPDDLGLCSVDGALTAHRLAVGAELPHDVVAERHAGGRPPDRNPSALAPPDLLRQVFQEQRVHRALEPDVQLVHLALGDRQDAHVGVGQPLEDGRRVLLVAADAVERLGNHDVEASLARVLEQPLQAGPVVRVRAG